MDWNSKLNSQRNERKISVEEKRSNFGDISVIRDLHVFFVTQAVELGASKVAFVQSKVRITPIKDPQREGERELSIPEAELIAAYLGVLIASTIISALEPLGIKLRVFLWSDSQIVHYLISKEDGHPRQFITNRVKIQQDVYSYMKICLLLTITLTSYLEDLRTRSYKHPSYGNWTQIG